MHGKAVSVAARRQAEVKPPSREINAVAVIATLQQNTSRPSPVKKNEKKRQ
jgi:hypothetical protein